MRLLLALLLSLVWVDFGLADGFPQSGGSKRARIFPSDRNVTIDFRASPLEGTKESPGLNDSQKTILIIGGAGSHALILSSDRTKWIELQLNIPCRMWDNGVAYLDEEIYFVGCQDNRKIVYKFGKKLKWKRLADMNVMRNGITKSCLAWNGYIWVFGGREAFSNYLNAVERYDPKENKWEFMSDMKHSRKDATALIWNDTIVVSGGYNANFPRNLTRKEIVRIDTVENFNHSHWALMPFTLPKPVAGHSLLLYQNKLVLLGGFNGSVTYNDVWELDSQEDNGRWESLPPMKYISSEFAATVFDQEIWAIGGNENTMWSQRRLDRVEIFNGKEWRDGPTLPDRYSRMVAFVIPQKVADRLMAYKPR